MKKILLMLILVITLTGCNEGSEAKITDVENEEEAINVPEVIEEEVIEEEAIELTEEEKFDMLPIDVKIDRLAIKLITQEISLPAYVEAFGEDSEHELVMVEINKVSDWYDWDEDGLPDYMEIFRNFTDPENPDTDGDGILDGDWEERQEYTYTVEVEARFINTYDLDFLENHHQQDILVIEETEDYLDALVLIYPFDKLNTTIVGNPNWIIDNSVMMKEIKPGKSTNWDDEFRDEIIKILEENGVYREKHSDLSYFINVVNVLEGKGYVSYDNLIEVTDELAYNNDIHMIDWFTTFDEEGKAVINEDAFKYRQDRAGLIDKLDEVIPVLEANTGSDWDYDRVFNTATAKGMLKEKFHGSCSSTSTFYASVFQALGIPTKVVPIQSVITDSSWHVKNYDGEYKAHKPVMDAVVNGLESEKMKKHFTDLIYVNELGGSTHITNYVYLGGRWVNVDIAGGFMFNRPPLQGRNGDMLSFYKISDYDFAGTVEKLGEIHFNRNTELFDKLNVSDNFPNSPENNIGNFYEGHSYKNYGFTDQYGEHITEETMDFIKNFKVEYYQKDMVKMYSRYRRFD